MSEERYHPCRWAAVLYVLLVLFVSCEARGKYVGVYKIERQGSAMQKEVILDLKENGDGLWKVGSDDSKGTFEEVRFAWYIKRGELRINTRDGGVMVGKISKDTIQVTLPGSKTLIFKKSQ
jgi:hypothetical protein